MAEETAKPQQAAETGEAAEPLGESRQAALARVSIEGISIGCPLEELPRELLDALEPVGEPYDSGAFVEGEEIGQRYQAPGIEVITSRAAPEVLERGLKSWNGDLLMSVFGMDDLEKIYDQELGREYVDTVILTGDNYQMVSGLKVGDSREEVRTLRHDVHGDGYTKTVGGEGSADVTVADGVVTQIRVYDMMGRRIGPFFDP